MEYEQRPGNKTNPHTHCMYTSSHPSFSPKSGLFMPITHEFVFVDVGLYLIAENEATPPKSGIPQHH